MITGEQPPVILPGENTVQVITEYLQGEVPPPEIVTVIVEKYLKEYEIGCPPSTYKLGAATFPLIRGFENPDSIMSVNPKDFLKNENYTEFYKTLEGVYRTFYKTDSLREFVEVIVGEIIGKYAFDVDEIIWVSDMSGFLNDEEDADPFKNPLEVLNDRFVIVAKITEGKGNPFLNKEFFEKMEIDDDPNKSADLLAGKIVQTGENIFLYGTEELFAVSTQKLHLENIKENKGKRLSDEKDLLAKWNDFPLPSFKLLINDKFWDRFFDVLKKSESVYETLKKPDIPKNSDVLFGSRLDADSVCSQVMFILDKGLSNEKVIYNSVKTISIDSLIILGPIFEEQALTPYCATETTCASNADCLDGSTCINGKCEYHRCSSGETCEAGLFCVHGCCKEIKCPAMTETGLLSCSKFEDCCGLKTEEKCPLICHSSGFCAWKPCGQNADCPFASYCKDGCCAPYYADAQSMNDGPPCLPCESTVGCAPGKICLDGCCKDPANECLVGTVPAAIGNIDHLVECKTVMDCVTPGESEVFANTYSRCISGYCAYPKCKTADDCPYSQDVSCHEGCCMYGK